MKKILKSRYTDLFRTPAEANVYERSYTETIYPTVFQRTFPGQVTFDLNRNETLFTYPEIYMRLVLRVKKRVDGKIVNLSKEGENVALVDAPFLT